MTIGTWCVLIDSLWQGDGSKEIIAGVDLMEVLGYIQHDYDEVDRLLIDMETQGA